VETKTAAVGNKKSVMDNRASLDEFEKKETRAAATSGPFRCPVRAEWTVRSCALKRIVGGLLAMIFLGGLVSATARTVATGRPGADTTTHHNVASTEGDDGWWGWSRWSLRTVLSPVNEADYFGQLLVVAGAFPIVFTTYTVPCALWSDVLVPFVKWLARAWDGFCIWLEETWRTWWDALRRTLVRVVTKCVEWANTLMERCIRPILRIVLQLIVVVAKTVWSFCGILGAIMLHVAYAVAVLPIVLATDVVAIIVSFFVYLARATALF
jgi:hypothetical protein